MVYNQRTQYIKQLKKMGANVSIENINGKHIINVSHSPFLVGAEIECTDIRGGMAAVLASSLAIGKTKITNEYQVKRGYNNYIEILNNFGFPVHMENQSENNFIKDFTMSQWSEKINKPWTMYKPNLKLTQSSNICVLGDCFARNFARWFREKGANIEDIPWGIHFHQKAILRELERTLNGDQTPDTYWILTNADGTQNYIDPFRHPVEGTSYVDLKYKQHCIEEKKLSCFKNTDIFIISLSIGEIWEEKINNVWQPLGRGPTEENFNPQIHRYRNLTVEETKKDIQHIILSTQKINPSSKIVFMVSPVPLKHSLHNEHIYISNNRSKTTLLAALYEVLDNNPKNVYYFPAYEIIQKDNQKKFWQDDERHLSAEAIDFICNEFINSFYAGKEKFNNHNIPAFVVRKVDKHGRVIEELPQQEKLLDTYLQNNNKNKTVDSNVANLLEMIKQSKEKNAKNISEKKNYDVNLQSDKDKYFSSSKNDKSR